MKWLEDLLKKVNVKGLAAPGGESRTGSVKDEWTETIVGGLTPSKMASILKDAAVDDPVDFLGLAEEMEEIDPHYGTVLRTRKLAISSIEPEITPASDDARDREIADFVKSIVEAPVFPDLMADLLDGLGKGYAVVAIEWDTTGKLWTPANYVWRDPRGFVWDRASRKIMQRMEDNSRTELDPFRYAVHVPKLKSGVPVRGALARLAAWSFLFKNYTVKDWVRFIEIFGMPLRVGKYNAHAKEEDKRQLLRALANLGTDAAGIIPSSMAIEFVQAASGTAAQGPVFGQFAKFLDEQVSKGVLGQTMTTDDGSSKAQAQVHNEVRLDIAKVDARQLQATLQRDIIIPACALNYGTLEKYPVITLPVEEPEDLKAWTSNVTEFMDRGLPVSLRQVRTMLTLDEPDDDDDTLIGRAANAGGQRPGEVPAKAHRAGCPCCGGRRLALATAEGEDELDRLVEAAMTDDAMDGLVEPVLEAVRKAKSYDEFVVALASVADEQDVATILRRLGSATFKARGLGSATDNPEV